MKYLNKRNRLIVIITSALSLLVYYPFAVFIDKAIWAKDLLSFNNADPNAVDKIWSFSANEASFIIPLIIMMIIIITCGFIGTYFIVKGKSKFERRWGWMIIIAGGFGVASVFALISFFIGKENKREFRPKGFKKVSGFRTATLIATPIIGIAPIFAIGFDNAGPDIATHVDGIKLAPNTGYKKDSKTGMPALDKDKNPIKVKTNLTNIIEISIGGLDPHMAMPSLEVDATLKDFKLFDHFVAPGADTSYSLPLELGGFKEYNEFYKRYLREGKVLSAKERTTTYELESFKKIFDVPTKPTAANSRTKVPNNYLLNPSFIGGNSYSQSVSGDSKLVQKNLTGVNVVNWAQTKEDLAGDFGVSKYSPNNSFFGWFNQESEATSESKTHVFLRESMTHPQRNTSRSGSASYWSGKNGNGNDLTLYNSTHAEIDSLNETIKHLQAIDAYDNSLIIIYGDHASDKTPIAHPGDKNPSLDKFHSVAMIKYPGQTAAPGEEEPEVTKIGFYGGDINQVISSFKSNPNTTFESEFVKDSKNIFGDPDDPTSKVYAGFYKSSLALFKFDHDGNLKIDTTKGRTPRNDGWITYDDFATKALTHRSSNYDHKDKTDANRASYRRYEANIAISELFGMVK